ncbi:MAG TPA: pyridoxal-dependent decarboxylase, partial [Candidatus Limnocylindrales bacterium]
MKDSVTPAVAPNSSDPEPRRPEARDRFPWHPEPELLDVVGEAASRPALEALGREAWQVALDYLYRHALARAAGEPAGYAELRRAFFGPSGMPAPAPAEPMPHDTVLEEFALRLAPHQLNSWHPRALSYFTPPPLMVSIMGELLAQVTNQGIDVWHAGPSGAFVEEEVGRWLCDLVGFGPDSFAVLTSGGVMANYMALAIARDVHLGRLLGHDVARPPRGRELENVRVYASDQAHFSIGRALDELGFPAGTLRVVPSDDRFRLQAGPVGSAILEDRAAGLVPLAIAAVAGSTNTGSIDAVDDLADLAAREGIWLHVDAAYGGAARLSARQAWRVPGLERADSLTIDPHKWFFQAYDVGGLLVRRRADLERTFHRSPEYYRGGRAVAASQEAEGAAGEGVAGEGATGAAGAPGEAGTEGEPEPSDLLNYYQLSFEGTRRWRALKLWLSWKHLGSEGLGHLVEQTLDVAGYLVRQIARSDDFEALPDEPELSVVCFRHLPGGRTGAGRLAPAELDAHQDALAHALEASGDGWLSTTRLRGATYLRAGIVNY